MSEQLRSALLPFARIPLPEGSAMVPVQALISRADIERARTVLAVLPQHPDPVREALRELVELSEGHGPHRDWHAAWDKARNALIAALADPPLGRVEQVGENERERQMRRAAKFGRPRPDLDFPAKPSLEPHNESETK